MRAFSRIALVLILVVLSSPLLLADHLQGDCPLTRAGLAPATSSFEASPHGVFRSGNSVFALRGQTLTTYTVNSLGELLSSREDVVTAMASRESRGGVAFANDILFLSSEAGLEIWDLRPPKAGTGAPALLSRTPGWHFRQLAVSGNTLAGLYPLTDMPCHPSHFAVPCVTRIEIFNVATLTSPVRVGSIVSTDNRLHWGFNDIAFSRGFLIVATEGGGLYSYNVSNPALPAFVSSISSPSLWLDASGGTMVVAGDDSVLHLFSVSSLGSLSRSSILTIPQYLAIERGNEIVFHRQAWIDEANGRIITMIDERDPQTLQPARTIAFDVFDLGMPPYEGNAERLYENVSMLNDDEVKFDPVAVGPYVYVVGDRTGLQTWGACGEVAGNIELDTIYQLSCAGSEIHGWVTGRQKIVAVELFLGSTSLGNATFGPNPRTDVSSRTPVLTWRVPVNLDETSRGERLIRAVATDALGNRRQFSSREIFFPGPGGNCGPRRRAVSGR
ncbi:MAG: hypothetical protein WA208_18875 [Thermoanaerobaculia bacterium]